MSERKIDLEVELDADAETVWKAISEAEELMRWFPPFARVEPGKSIWISWGPPMEATAPVDVWEPGHRLRFGEQAMFTDFIIKTHEGSTILRCVTSGFGEGESWDTHYNSMEAGWRYFLFNLKHYIERHRGVGRRVAWVRWPMSVSQDEAATVLFGPDGFDLRPMRPVEVGSAYRMRFGDRELAGQVGANSTNTFAGTLPELNDGLFFVELEPGDRKWHCGIWVSLYGEADVHADAVESALSSMMQRLYPPSEGSGVKGGDVIAALAVS